MKKILKELKRIFPDRFVSIHLDMIFDRNGILEESYQAYVIKVKLGDYDVTDDFPTLKELDNYLSEKIETYKSQIK